MKNTHLVCSLTGLLGGHFFVKSLLDDISEK